MSSTTTSTPSSTSSSSPSATSDSSNFSFIGNTPSSVLFFLALGVGVFIATLFLFFTVRYFIRSKYGLHIYPASQRSIFSSASLNTTNLSMMYHTNSELQEQLEYIRRNHYIRADVLDRRLNNRRRRRRRRRNRFAKMKKISEQQVEALFPKKTYNDWLNGGKERDDDKRNGNLQEEGYDNDSHDEQLTTQKTITTNSEIDQENPQEIELTDLPTRNEIIEQDLHFTSGTCAICLEIIEDDDVVRGLLCGHVFHADCLDPWLTKRRACCPMCKRDYYYKDENRGENNENEGEGEAGENNEENQNEDHQNEDQNDDEEQDGENDETLDFEVFRNDPTLRAMLHELIPVSERVRMILNDETLSHLNLEVAAKEIANQKYSNIFKIIFWKIMGISKTDLYNYGVLTLSHNYRLEQEIRENSNQPLPDLDSPDGEVRSLSDNGANDNNSHTPTPNDENTIDNSPPDTNLSNGDNSVPHPNQVSQITPRTSRSHAPEEQDLGSLASVYTAPSARDVVDNRV